MRRFLARMVTLVVVLAILAGAPAALAQGGPIQVGENKIGEITAAGTSQSYTIALAIAQVIDIQVLAITQGFAPALRLYDPSGVLMESATNSAMTTSGHFSGLELAPGVYRVEVSSANGMPGQFVIGVQAGASLPAPVPLVLGQPAEGDARSDLPRLRYSFVGSMTEGLRLNVRSENPNVGPVITLKDAETLETLAVSGPRLAGASYRIPAGAIGYLLEVSHGGSAGAEAFNVCLEVENGTGPVCPTASGTVAQVPTPTPIPPQIVPTPTTVQQQQLPPPLPATGACVVASLTGGAVNIRSGPSTAFPPLMQISGEALAPVIGRLPDNTWFQVNINGVIGWISTSVVRIGGQCNLVGVVVPTPTATLPSAPPPQPPTWTPTWTPTPTETSIPPAPATLDYSLPPNYGTTALSSGFVPDPFSIGITSGGDIDVSYLGGGCSGFATAAPDFSINYTSGAFPTLSIYFIGSGDTTLIINSPTGTWACVDDSYGTLNPTVDFSSPVSGRYDIWIGSYASGSYVSGTLYITENTANHP